MAKIKGRPSKYRKSLQIDENWQEIRRKVKIRDEHKCRCCGSKRGLDVHHITYYVNGKSIRGLELENMKWMITVCRDCHTIIHQLPNHELNPNNKMKQDAETYNGLS